MRASESQFLQIRELRYHVRRWAKPGAPKMVLLHGWMDVSASFQFMVDALKRDWDVYAPDWRGYGLTEWGKGDCYWFADYIADLHFLLEAVSPGAPVNLVGHSLGGNVAALYAGTRPERIRKLVNLEGFGLKAVPAEKAPSRYAEWLEELRSPPQLRPYASFDELAARLRKTNPRLKEKAHFLARHWGQEKDGKVTLRADPAHKIVNATLYRYEEALACWRKVSAPVLWVEGEEWDTLKSYGPNAGQLVERREAFPNLRHVSIPGAGHMLHHDQPEALARVTEDFLEG